MKQTTSLELVPLKELNWLNQFFDDDIIDRLWYEYFYPKEKHDPKRQKFILAQYNELANVINERAQFNRVILLTLSTKVEKLKPEDEGPNMLKPIYAEIVEFKGKSGKQDTAVSPAPKDKQRKINAGKLDPVTNDLRPDKKQSGKKDTQAVAKVSKSDLPGTGDSVIEKIINWHKSGKSKKEIIAMGFNSSTVNRQVGEYIKDPKKFKK